MVSAFGHVFGLRDPGRRTETNPENDRTAFSVADNVRQKEGQRFAGECRVLCSIMGLKREKAGALLTLASCREAGKKVSGSYRVL